jgi:hypothetical protein
MKKTFVFLLSVFVVTSLFAVTTEYDSNGYIVQGYGNRRYKDGQEVSFKYFQEIRLFSGIELDNWYVVEQELDAGIDINAKVIVAEGNIRMEYTPLAFAVMNGKSNMAIKLLERGARNNYLKNFVQGKSWNTSITDLIFQHVYVTKQLSRDVVLKELEENGGSHSYNGNCYLYACIGEDGEVIEKMLSEEIKLANRGADEEEIEEIIKETILDGSIPTIFASLINSKCIRAQINGKTDNSVSVKSTFIIMQLLKTPFGTKYSKELKEIFFDEMEKIDAETQFGKDENYQKLKLIFEML